MLVYRGWPGHQRWWPNQHLSRFFGRARKWSGTTPVPQRLKRRAGAERLRVGCVGRFSGLLGFPREVFEAFPAEWDLHVYDVEWRGQHAPYLAQIAVEYVQVGGVGDVFRRAQATAAQAINTADLDLLLVINHKSDAYDLLDLVETSCIVQQCTGIELLHHPKVSFHLCPQLQADYFMSGDRLFCGTTRAPLPGHPVYYGFIACDPRGLPPPPVNSWHERDNLILFHGSMYKAASAPFLETIYALLKADASLQFVLMGRDSGGSLALIDDLARRHGVAAQVHWDGAFHAGRDADGAVSDPGWQRLIANMRRARLAPDPWPVIGWSSRLEAMLLGAPTVHLALRTDPPTWGRMQPVVFDSPQLNVPAGTVSCVSDYFDRCRACLYDERFADRLIAEQLAVAATSVDFPAYWKQLGAARQKWVAST
jgi:hypothetical protein